MSRPVVISPEERALAERMAKARDQVMRIVMEFDGPDQPMNILESAMAYVVRERCRGFMHKAVDLVAERVKEKLARIARGQV